MLYPFGMGITNRKFSNDKYRYGFNGQEIDKDITSGDFDYGSRIYDTRIGRWLSLDPLQKKYPNESNYVYVSNSPILFKDVDGKDKVVTITILNKDGSKSVLKRVDKNYFHYHTVKGGTYKGDYLDRDHKESIAMDYTIDNRGESTKISYSSYAFDINYNYTYVEQAEDWLGDLFTDSPRKYGLKMTGGGDGISPEAQLEWDSNLPIAENSDFIGSISGLLDAASNFREFSPTTKDGDEFKHELFQFIKNENYKEFTEMADNWVDALNAMKSAVEGSLNSVNFSSNLPDNNTTYCKACKGNYKKDKNGYPTWDTSMNKASDTTDSHGVKPIKKTNE